jgi:hypothetical protein
MNITREEAEVILGLIDNGNIVTDSNIVVLHKINKAYPALLAGTKYVSILAEDAKKKETIKRSALAKIAGLLEDAKANVEEAVKTAKAAGVGFDFYIGDFGGNFDPREGWNSSNC